MAINFPNSPSVNETHSHSGKEWTWNGSSWVLSTNASSYTLPIATGIALGGIKVGSRLSIDSGTGVLDADVQGGTTTFTGLTDTPGNFTSQAGKYLKVNAGATALEFVTLPVDPDTNTNDYLSSASLSGNTLTLGRTGSQSLADLTVDLSSLGGGASVTIDDAAPTSPNAGDMWWDSDDGRLKIYYTDATPDSQWVDASPIGSSNLSVGNSSVSITDTGSNGTIQFNTEGTDRWKITALGHIHPNTNAAFDIGSAEYKVRHLFLSDNSLYFVNDSNVQKIMSVTAGGSLQYDGKDLLQNVVINGLDNNHTIKYNGTNWVNEAPASTPTFLGLSDTPSSFTAGKWLKVNAGGTALEETDAPASGGSPGGSNTQLQINDNGAFGGCNIEYNPTHLDGGLEWANASGTPGAAIRCYHSSISGGDNSMLFYTGGGLLGTINLRIFNNSVTVYGSLTKGGGSFRIPHPLPALNATKDLAHSFIEGPQCDNLYRGKVDLVGGTATINIDTKAGMTEGTFVVLNRDIQCFTTNETGWTLVKGSVSGNTLTITAQDNTCTDTISWMVIGERQDDTVKGLDITDADGNLVIEPDQIPLPTI